MSDSFHHLVNENSEMTLGFRYLPEFSYCLEVHGERFYFKSFKEIIGGSGSDIVKNLGRNNPVAFGLLENPETLTRIKEFVHESREIERKNLEQTLEYIDNITKPNNL